MSAIVRFNLLEENWPDNPAAAYLPDFEPVLLGDLVLGSAENERTIPQIDLIAYIDVLLLTIGLAAAFAAPQTAGGDRTTTVIVQDANLTISVANLAPATYPLACLTRGLGQALVELITIVLGKCPDLLSNPLLRGWNFIRAHELARARGALGPMNAGVLRVRFDATRGGDPG